MTKGYITEIFSSFQGEGAYAGRRQIFIRFAGCPLSCFYCDTPYARDATPGFCTALKKKPGTKRNPVSTNEVMDYVKELLTPDLHSVSYTGGEPLFSAEFVKEIAAEATRMQLKNFIETNGYSAEAFASVADFFDFASIDIKLKNHRAVAEKDYDRLYSNAVECIRIAIDRGIETIVKVVVIKNTAVEEIEEICRDLADLNIKFVLQPVTAPPDMQSADVVPGIKELFALSETAGLFLRHVMVIPQLHKFMRIR
ncbi:MAG: 7-carboxy-7-deazaguanine synthase QueE [Methanomicrobia archaeon]|nr:7-carboxy-7-deazaguanine synthase QueE [Methanomicrobia archaeon]